MIEIEKRTWSWLMSSYSKQLAQEASLWSSQIGFLHLTQKHCGFVSRFFHNKNIVRVFLFCHSLTKHELDFLMKSRYCSLLLLPVTEKVTGEKLSKWTFKIRNRKLLTCNKSTRFICVLSEFCTWTVMTERELETWHLALRSSIKNFF